MLPKILLEIHRKNHLVVISGRAMADKLCEVGKVLEEVYNAFLHQKNPKPSKLDISSAKLAYTNHVKLCEKCTKNDR